MMTVVGILTLMTMIVVMVNAVLVAAVVEITLK